MPGASIQFGTRPSTLLPSPDQHAPPLLPFAFCLLLSAFCFLPSAFFSLLSALCFLLLGRSPRRLPLRAVLATKDAKPGEDAGEVRGEGEAGDRDHGGDAAAGGPAHAERAERAREG